MLYKSSLFSQASGSMGGTTFAHNRGGQYTRQRSTPTNPNSPQQQAVRAFFGNLAVDWADSLTAAQRDAWAVYANNVPVINRVGDPILLPPLAMFIRCNVPRLQAGLDQVNDGPTVYTLGSYDNPSFAGDATADEVDVTFNDADDWANEDDAAMLIFASRPQLASVNYFKGPYRFADLIAGDSVTPPASPAAITAPFPFAAGQRVFVRAIVTRADGRLSLPFRDFALGA